MTNSDKKIRIPKINDDAVLPIHLVVIPLLLWGISALRNKKTEMHTRKCTLGQPNHAMVRRKSN